ncbi:lysophospholipid acyltransferase family protein [Angustibacter sp. McL0619]|uniref:lysophospholipid acyltransferase family protein n=1 Tax=Angustibacter sp. McL0619 TaxID=3415676 RepID=UPI003CED9FC5
MFYWLMKTVVLGPILRLIFRPWVTGVDNVPTEGPAILASNHLSFSDSIFLPLLLDRKVTFLAKADYFTGRGAKGRATALFFRLADQLPIDRGGGRASEAALNTGMRVLTKGDLLGIYPEGTRSPDGRLYRGKTGVARMALEGGVPVLPVVMVGTDKAQPIGHKLPKITRIGVRIGAPLDFSRYEGMEGDRFVLRSITDEIMYELMQLSGQEYVDVYAASMKERLAAAKRGRTVSLPGDPEDEGEGPGAEPELPADVDLSAVEDPTADIGPADARDDPEPPARAAG